MSAVNHRYTTLELLEMGRYRMQTAWTRGRFAEVHNHMVYFCALGGLTPPEAVEDVNYFWGLDTDFTERCGLKNGMECDATRWLADAIREMHPAFAAHSDRHNGAAWKTMNAEQRLAAYRTIHELPQWVLDHPLIVEFNDAPGRTKYTMIMVYTLAILRYRESLAAVSVSERELATSGD